MKENPATILERLTLGLCACFSSNGGIRIIQEQFDEDFIGIGHHLGNSPIAKVTLHSIETSSLLIH